MYGLNNYQSTLNNPRFCKSDGPLICRLHVVDTCTIYDVWLTLTLTLNLGLIILGINEPSNCRDTTVWIVPLVLRKWIWTNLPFLLRSVYVYAWEYLYLQCYVYTQPARSLLSCLQPSQPSRSAVWDVDQWRVCLFVDSFMNRCYLFVSGSVRVRVRVRVSVSVTARAIG